MNEPAIRLSGVTKSFGSNRAVDNLDLTVPRGSIYGLLGPNGAGKTTTIRIMLDILGPDAGTVEVLGRHVDEEVRSRTGYLPEERGLYQKMTVIDQLIFLGVLKGMSRAEARREGSGWLERLELEDRAAERVDTLSKGMQQKVQFISTILHRPDLLILDEPFSGLDPINADLLKEIVLERNEAGVTVLFSTHRIEDAERLCGRVCMIAGARKVLDGSVDEVRAGAGRREAVLELERGGWFLEDSSLVAKVTDHGRYLEVRLAEGADPRELLRRALDAGVPIRRFELVEPSLRDIFLERASRKGLPAAGPEASESGGPRSAAPGTEAVREGVR